MRPTAEAGVLIEEESEGCVRYVREATGERWEVHGVCDRRGECLVGAVVDGEVVETIERARELARTYAGPDVPVTRGFKGCCPLAVYEL
jgi:hypothetical protein